MRKLESNDGSYKIKSKSDSTKFENIKKLAFAILDEKNISEIKLNNNGIVPLPGTKQGNHLVHFYNSNYKEL